MMGNSVAAVVEDGYGGALPLPRSASMVQTRAGSPSEGLPKC